MMVFCTVSSISIHAPREGSDPGGRHRQFHLRISIHAPREGSDRKPPASLLGLSNFYPRSPRGERQVEQGCRDLGDW